MFNPILGLPRPSVPTISCQNRTAEAVSPLPNPVILPSMLRISLAFHGAAGDAELVDQLQILPDGVGVSDFVAKQPFVVAEGARDFIS